MNLVLTHAVAVRVMTNVIGLVDYTTGMWLILDESTTV
jgi:hypothetical protein